MVIKNIYNSKLHLNINVVKCFVNVHVRTVHMVIK